MGHGVGLPGMTTMACRGFTQNQPVRAWTLGEGSSVVTHSAPVRCSHRERPHPAILQSCTTCPQSTPGTSFWSPLEAALEVRGGGRWPPEGWRYVFSSAFPLLPNSRDSTEQRRFGVQASEKKQHHRPALCAPSLLGRAGGRQDPQAPGARGLMRMATALQDAGPCGSAGIRALCFPFVLLVPPLLPGLRVLPRLHSPGGSEC